MTVQASFPSRAFSAATTTSPNTTSEPPKEPVTPLQYKYFINEKVVEDAPDMVKQSLSLANADAPERKQAEKRDWIHKLQIRPGDTGSTPVQGESAEMEEKGSMVVLFPWGSVQQLEHWVKMMALDE